MSALEHVVAQTTEVINKTPTADMHAAVQSCAAAAAILLETASHTGSPPLREIVTMIDTARVRLLGAVSMVNGGTTELATYVNAVGCPMPEVRILTEIPCTLRNEELEEQLYAVEKLAGIAGGYRPYYSADEITKSHSVACKEALRHPATRERMLSVIEKLLSATVPGHDQNSYHNHNRQRGALLALSYCADELIALAEQTDDMPLAARARGLLFEALPVGPYPNTVVYDYIDTVFVTSLLERAHYTKQFARRWHESGNDTDLETFKKEDQKNTRQITAAAVRIIGNWGERRGHIARALIELEGSDDFYIHGIAKETLEAVTADNHTLNSFLVSLGLPRQEVVESWTIGYGNAGQPGYKSSQEIRKNHVEIIKKLEKHRHGTVAALYQKLRIRNFERFPINMLRDVIDRIELGPPPNNYALYVQGTRSHNAAFRESDELSKLHNDATALDYLIVPMELNSEEDLEAIHETLTKAGWPAANTLVVHAHGRHTGITPGDYVGYSRVRPEPYSIKTQDIVSTSPDGPAARLAQLVKPDGTIILRSCNAATGHETSFASQLNQTTGRKVVAPSMTVSSKGIIVDDQTTGLPTLMARYFNNNGEHMPTVFPATGNPL